jgi:5-methylcytosine-specific restriction enzyme B
MSDKVRVYEIAEEIDATSAEVINKAKDLGFELKSPQSAVSFEDAEEITNYIMTGKSSKISSKTALKSKKKKPELKKVTISNPNISLDKLVAMKVNEIATKTELTPEKVIEYAKIIGYQKAKHSNTSIPIEIAKKIINYIETEKNTTNINSSPKEINQENQTHKQKFSTKKIQYKFEYKNILFKGVPGTGKSRTIDKIIENNLNLKEESNILRINIHSSSSNSDLMQGIGINSNDGTIEYKEKQGLILDFIQKATFNPYQPFVLILEEIQENSLNELIGDLIYLIEDSKRTTINFADDNNYTYEELIEKIQKQNKEKLSTIKLPNLVSQNNIYKTMLLPNNLFIFCTSNYRDDKKVIEDNLLRRFDVIEIYPKYKEDLGNDFKTQTISNFLRNLNLSILEFCRDKGEIHPDRFMIGHSIWLKINNEKDFKRAFLKVITEFKDIKDFHFDDFNEIVKDITFPYQIKNNYNSYQEWINELQKNCYNFL